jgi:hypothetical protein
MPHRRWTPEEKIRIVLGSLNTSIVFRTKYEGDLKAIARMRGSGTSAIIPRLPVGYSIFHLADVGDPFVLA